MEWWQITLGIVALVGASYVYALLTIATIKTVKRMLAKIGVFGYAASAIAVYAVMYKPELIVFLTILVFAKQASRK